MEARKAEKVAATVKKGERTTKGSALAHPLEATMNAMQAKEVKTASQEMDDWQ